MRKLANSAARDIASPAVKMGNKGLFPGVAVPLAFFCTLFFRHRKKSVSAPWDGQSQSAPESARQAPPGAGDCACGRTGGFPLAPSPLRFASRSNRAPHRAASPAPAPESVRQAPTKGIFLRQGCLLSCKQGAFRSPPAPLRAVVGEKTQGLSSGQTIGAVRTAVRSACCLPELRVANRLRRLYPLDTRFPPFPFGNLRITSDVHNCKLFSCAKFGASGPAKGICLQQSCRLLLLAGFSLLQSENSPIPPSPFYERKPPYAHHKRYPLWPLRNAAGLLRPRSERL